MRIQQGGNNYVTKTGRRSFPIFFNGGNLAIDFWGIYACIFIWYRNARNLRTACFYISLSFEAWACWNKRCSKVIVGIGIGMKNPETSRKKKTWRSNCLCTCLNAKFVSTAWCIPPKTNMAMAIQPFEDKFPVLKMVIFPLPCWLCKWWFCGPKNHQISSHWWRPGYNPTIFRAEIIHPGKLTCLNPTKKGLEFGLEDDVPLQLGDWLGSKC